VQSLACVWHTGERPGPVSMWLVDRRLDHVQVYNASGSTANGVRFSDGWHRRNLHGRITGFAPAQLRITAELHRIYRLLRLAAGIAVGDPRHGEDQLPDLIDGETHIAQFGQIPALVDLALAVPEEPTEALLIRLSGDGVLVGRAIDPRVLPVREVEQPT